MYGSEERGSYKVYPKCSFLSDFLVSRNDALEHLVQLQSRIDAL